MTARIHPTALIHPQAELDTGVEVGPYTVIEAGVTVGAATKIGAHVVLSGRVDIGRDNEIFAGAVLGSPPQDFKYDGSPSLVKIGDGNIIREYVTINRANREGESTVLGDRNLLMAYSHIGHNCVIADQVVMANGVTLAGYVQVESRAWLSGLLGVHQFVRIGQLAMVAGISRVLRDVPPFMLVEGNPGRIRALNQVGLQRAGVEGADLRSLKQAFRILYRSGLTLSQAIPQLATLPETAYLVQLQEFLDQAQGEGRRGLTPAARTAPASE